MGAVGSGVAVAAGAGDGDGVAVGVGAGDGVALGDGAGVSVGVGVSVSLGGTAVAVGEGGCGVALTVGVGEGGCGVGLAVGVSDGPGVADGVGVTVSTITVASGDGPPTTWEAGGLPMPQATMPNITSNTIQMLAFLISLTSPDPRAAGRVDWHRWGDTNIAPLGARTNT